MASETGKKEQITAIPTASPTEMPENRKDSSDKDEEPVDNSGRSDKNKVGNGEPGDREEKKSDDVDPVPGNSKSGDETDAAPDDAGSEEDADPGEDDGSDREGRNGNGSEEDKNDSGNRKDDKKSDDSDHRKKDDENESGMNEDREPTEAAETEAPTPSPSETPQRPADNTPRTPTTVPTATPSPTETPTPRPTETQPLSIPVQRISIADSFAHTNVVNYVLNAGESYKIPLTVYPANATEKITWRASGGGVRIDDNGVVTNPGYAGVVDITAQSGNVSAKATMILTNVSEASSGQCGDEVYWEVSGNTLHFYGKGDMWPDKGGDRMLTNPWLSHANEITKVKIDAGITSIEHSAFYALYRVSEVRIPKGVTKLGDWVFVWCRAGVIHLPNTLHYVADSAIWGINTFYPEIVFHGTWEEWDAIDKNGKIRNCQVTFVEE